MTKSERREYMRNWKLKNPEKVKQYSKKYAGRYAEREKKYRQKHRTRYRQYASQYRKDNPEKCKQYKWKYWLKSKYGLSPTDYEKLILEQRGLCGICGIPQNELKRKLHVDHNHVTGTPRGLLCSNCNHAIECFERDPLFFDKIKEYIEKWKE